MKRTAGPAGLLPGLIAIVAVLALGAASVAEAKFRITLTLADTTPAVAQAVPVTIRTAMTAADARQHTMRLVAVPPGVGIYAALGDEPRYAVRLTRSGATWRGVVRLRHPGTWKLVVPNWGAPGYALPPPVIRRVTVH